MYNVISHPLLTLLKSLSSLPLASTTLVDRHNYWSSRSYCHVTPSYDRITSHIIALSYIARRGGCSRPYTPTSLYYPREGSVFRVTLVKGRSWTSSRVIKSFAKRELPFSVSSFYLFWERSCTFIRNPEKTWPLFLGCRISCIPFLLHYTFLTAGTKVTSM